MPLGEANWPVMEGKHNTRVDPHDEPRMHQLVVAVKRRAPGGLRFRGQVSIACPL